MKTKSMKNLMLDKFEDIAGVENGDELVIYECDFKKLIDSIIELFLQEMPKKIDCPTNIVTCQIPRLNVVEGWKAYNKAMEEILKK